MLRNIMFVKVNSKVIDVNVDEIMETEYESIFSEILSLFNSIPSNEDNFLNNDEATTLIEQDTAKDEVLALGQFSVFD